MNKVWECVVDVFIGIIIIFLSVTAYFGLRAEAVTKSMYEGITEEFVADVKKSGVLTVSDYENFIERMEAGNSLFNISFEHRFKIFEPEYRFRTIEEILEEQRNSYTGTNEYHYREVVTTRPQVNDPINDGNLNTETNESVLAKVVNTSADPNHTHDESCYYGHKHSGTPYFIHSHRHTTQCVEFRAKMILFYECRDCHTQGGSLVGVWYWDEETQSPKLYSSITPICGNCGSQNFINATEHYGYGYSCGYSKDINGDGLEDRIGTEQTYDYEKDYPQPRAVTTKKDYISGCYKYHEMGELSKYKNVSWDTEYRTEVLSVLLSNGFTSFCKIPSTIELRCVYGDESEQYYYYSLYFSVRHNNGVITFAVSAGVGLGIYDIFPDVDLAKFQTLLYNSTELLKFIREYANRDIVSSARYNEVSRVYGELTICSEASHNTWYTTCGQAEDTTADCNGIIITLTPTHSVQKIYTNDPLITTAVAVYKDGSSKTVVCTTNFSTSVAQQNKTVTLTYNYSIEGVAFSKTSTITVTVIPRNKTCLKGHVYNLNEDGSDPGCPYCRAWVESLSIINPTTTPYVITVGTTLRDNNFKILVTYMDGHTEVLTNGYMDNLDSAYLGTKPVTIGYKGVSITVPVTTVCATMVCDICSYSYELYPDGTNPGCPRCIQKIPVFTGNIMTYEHLNSSDEILEALYSDERYVFNVGDSFSVHIDNKSSTIARMLLRKVYPSLSNKWFYIDRSEMVLSK